MKHIFDEAVLAEKFSGPKLLKALQAGLAPESALAQEYRRLKAAVGQKVADHAFMGVVRATFLIELVKTPKIETTKFEVRWADRLPVEDPRHASYDNCLNICTARLSDLAEAMGEEEKKKLLTLFAEEKIVPYEVPIDYLERRQETQIHALDNVGWFWDDVPAKTVRLRHFLRTQIAEDHRKVFALAYDKIKVKTYLTDRVLTGAHKTNREKRWETHPGSVHFALRRDCLDIERSLIEQVCMFDGFPHDLQEKLIGLGLIGRPDDVSRCPVTMEPLLYSEFERELREPDHGKASFQVGHLNPLKAINDDPQSGHTALNISWVSADGNRIQGSLSLAETRDMIRKIYGNYTRLNVT